MKWQSFEPCITCGKCTENGNAIHHEAFRKSHPELADEPNNHFILCARCHQLRHALSQSQFIKMFPVYEAHLKNKGWEFCEYKKKYVYHKK